VAVRALPDSRNVHVLLRGSGEGSARQFTFDGVLGPDASQEDVFRLAGVRNLIDSGLRGENVSILAYGQTGSGKTYTMSGVSERENKGSVRGDTIGIIPRAVKYLFSRIASEANATTSVEASFCEIYNENLYDLLNLSGETLQLRHSPRRGFHVKGQLIVKCDDAQDVFEVLDEGHRTRSVASHALNADSSRSHSILTLVIKRTVQKQRSFKSGDDAVEIEDEQFVGQSVTTSKIIFVDLAGSERIKDSKSEGLTAMEGRQINKSLFTLGKVIACLGSAQQKRGRRPEMMDTSHIPYRDSTLTKLLADSLGGSARTLLLSCVSPASEFTDETLSTLQFTLRASRIENAPIVQLIGGEKSDVAQQHVLMVLKRENRALKRENEALRMRLGLPLTGSIDQFLAESALTSPGQLINGRGVATTDALKVTSDGEDVTLGDQSKLLDISNGAGGGGGSLKPILRLPIKPQGVQQGMQQTSSNSSTGRRSRASSGKVGRTNLSSGGGRVNNSVNPYAQLFPPTDGHVSDGSVGPLSSRAPQFASRIDARLAERGGTKLVLDAQQAELEQLHKERDHLVEKGKAAKARIAALQFSLVVYKGTIERMAIELESSRRQHDRLLHGQFSQHPNDSTNLSVFSSSVGNDGEGPSTAVSEHSDMSSLEKLQLNAVEIDLQQNHHSLDFEVDGDDKPIEPQFVSRGLIRGSSQSRIPVLMGR